MDPTPHHNPQHWGYNLNQQNTWIPPPIKKRAVSDSDCEEIYSEESSKEPYEIISPGQTSNTESDSCQMMSCKRRRGVIEKKRRDKINTSLCELKRLVPTAYEKQGSAKLEKAEILQLTVDHLKNLQAKGYDSSIDHQPLAFNYHIIGFRECAAEVARYLVKCEGMDIQDPLRMRLMAHLQEVVAQREFVMKSGSQTNWTHQNFQTPPTYSPVPIINPIPVSPYHQGYTSSSHSPSTNPSGYMPNVSSSSSVTSASQHYSTSNEDQHSSSTTTTNSISSHSDHHSQNSQNSSQHIYPITQDVQEGSIYTDLSSSVHRGASTSIGAYSNTQYLSGGQMYPPNGAPPTAIYNGSGMKPYRPWGAEMAY